MSEEKAGLAAAMKILGVGDAPGEGRQLELIDEPDVAMPTTPAKRGPGRPAGARNRRTQEWVDYILARYRSPLVVLAEIYSRTPEELATELKLYERVPIGDGQYEDRLATGEAFKRQMEALQAILPYVHQKQPMAVELNAKTAGMIVIGELKGLEADGDGTLVLSMENQGVSEPQAQVSDASQSDASANALPDNAKAGRND